jgi:signal transduction histidine kinase
MSADDGWPADAEARLTKLVHDLRTPLTVAAGFADLLAAGPDLDAERRAEYARRVADAARDMRDILDAERADRHTRRDVGE